LRCKYGARRELLEGGTVEITSKKKGLKKRGVSIYNLGRETIHAKRTLPSIWGGETLAFERRKN